ncbi:MAG: hypothetical protein E6R03_07960 [Hyphomicrobiaceae bacterium]|nr:MAG: hypothetical protein E6R03_07960 [Hyphomicrobiaceae bacterium]
MSRLREVSSEDYHEQGQPQAAAQQASAPNQVSAAHIQILLLALKTLSQRTVLALAALKAMILAGTVFWLALTIMPEPSSLKLTGLAIYSIFILLVTGMDLRRK